MSEPRKKVTHIGAPACFALEMACKQLMDAFDDDVGHVGIYLVGSALERADWRDVDVRMMLDDATFAKMFPKALVGHGAAWEFDPRWTLMTVCISTWLREKTGLPVDFQFQPMSFANEKHKGKRHALGLRFVAREPEPLPPTGERVTVDAAGIGFTLNQEVEPPKAPTFAEQIALK